jgi:hypothetical protein
MEVVSKEERQVFGRVSSWSNRCVVVYDAMETVALPNIQGELALSFEVKLP